MSVVLPDADPNVFAELRRGLGQGAYLRTLNFHNLTRARLPEYERQLAYAAESFSAVGESDLEAFFTTKRWAKAKPGLLPAFYEGYRNNYDIGVPLLERYGFVGWFFIPTDFVSLPAERQRPFADEHHIGLVEEPYEDPRVAMTWGELRDLKRRGHVVASHTCTHAPLTTGSLEAELRREIVGSQEAIRRELGGPAGAFAWLFGGEYRTNPAAHRHLAAAGYRYLFSNFKIQRLEPGGA